MTKKIILLGLVLAGIFFFNFRVSATSGACSYHGGVDCSAGADYDGSVICNDGWTDSSVAYSAMVMCGGGSNSYYSEPSICDSIRNNPDYSQALKQTKLAYYGCSGASSYYNAPVYTPIPTCPLLSSYDSLSGTCKCYAGYVSDGSSCVSGNSYCWKNYGFFSTYDSSSKSCECDSGYVLTNGQCIRPTPAPTICPLNSYASGTQCKCNSGYVVGSSGNSCVAITDYCHNLYGYNSYGIGSSCYCQSGYQWDSLKTTCIQSSPLPTFDEEKLQKEAADGLRRLQQTPLSTPQVKTLTPVNCKEGYALSLNKTKCYKLPLNSHPASDGKNVWLCDDGYMEKGNSCILSTLAPFPSATPSSTPVPKKKKFFFF